MDGRKRPPWRGTWLKLGGSSKAGIVAIAAQNDAMAIGARKAFQELSNEQERAKWMRLPFLGCDGVPKTGQAWVRSGLLAATVITPPMAGQAVQLMASALRNNTTVPERTVDPCSNRIRHLENSLNSQICRPLEPLDKEF